jgi:hypothetical protein
VTIYTDDKSLLSDSMSRISEKDAALDLGENIRSKETNSNEMRKEDLEIGA